MCENSSDNCQTCERKSFHMNPTWCKYFLHSLQGQVDGIHFLIFDLKSSSDTDRLIWCGNKSHIFGPKWDRVWVTL